MHHSGSALRRAAQAARSLGAFMAAAAPVAGGGSGPDADEFAALPDEVKELRSEQKTVARP